MPDLTIPTAFKSGGHLARFSSRQGKLASVYLSDRLKSARKYDRIAGYFRSSIFEIVGEELANIEDVRIVANSDLDFADIQAAKAVRDAALFRRFVEGDSVLDAALHRDRYRLAPGRAWSVSSALTSARSVAEARAAGKHGS